VRKRNVFEEFFFLMGKWNNAGGGGERDSRWEHGKIFVRIKYEHFRYLVRYPRPFSEHLWDPIIQPASVKIFPPNL
jgi:hypothetical protein